MAPEEQLEWEARAGRLAAAAAFASAALILAGALAEGSAVGSAPQASAERLEAVAGHSSDLGVAEVIGAVGLAALAAVLWYLFQVTKRRRPELPRAVMFLAVAGPFVAAILGVVTQLDEIASAREFVSGGLRTDERAADLRTVGPALFGLGIGSTFATAGSMVFLGVNAMRAGLLSRFLGVFSAVVGVLFIIPIPVALPLLVFWLVSLGLLFLDRWPGGRGPAWRSVDAIPWPGAAEQREAMARRREEQGGAQAAQPAGNGTGSSRATPVKRKRKRRR